MRVYYTLIVKTPGQLWTPEFGDYDRAVVEQERDDAKANWAYATKFKIIRTGEKQSDIFDAVEIENAKVVI